MTLLEYLTKKGKSDLLNESNETAGWKIPFDEYMEIDGKNYKAIRTKSGTLVPVTDLLQLSKQELLRQYDLGEKDDYIDAYLRMFKFLSYEESLTYYLRELDNMTSFSKNEEATKIIDDYNL